MRSLLTIRLALTAATAEARWVAKADIYQSRAMHLTADGRYIKDFDVVDARAGGRLRRTSSHPNGSHIAVGTRVTIADSGGEALFVTHKLHWTHERTENVGPPLLPNSQVDHFGPE